MHTESRQLVIMRHAKAEQVGPSDLERTLTEGGRADAAEAGRWLVDEGFRPAHALVSSAVRTRETWAALSSAAGWGDAVDVDFQAALFSAGPETALDLVRLLPANAPSALVLGHNPTVATLAQLLDDGTGDSGAARAMTEGFPPAALAVFEVEGEWASLDLGSARLVAFHVGHG